MAIRTGWRTTTLLRMSSWPAGRARFVMGMAQMFGAVAGLVLLIATGPSAATLVVVALTTALALTSRALARGRRLPRKRSPAA